MPQRLCSLRVISGEIVRPRHWRVTNRYKSRPKQSQDMGVMSNSQATRTESPRKEGKPLAVMAAVAIPMSQMMTTGNTAVMMSQTQDTAEGARD